MDMNDNVFSWNDVADDDLSIDSYTN